MRQDNLEQNRKKKKKNDDGERKQIGYLDSWMKSVEQGFFIYNMYVDYSGGRPQKLLKKNNCVK